MEYLPLIVLLWFFGPALAAIPVRFSIRPWQHWALIGICIVFGTSPFMFVFGGLYLADLFGCQAKMTIFTCSQQPWLGNVISFMVFAHWFAILTIPSAAVGLLVLVIKLIQSFSKKSEGEIEIRAKNRFRRSRGNKVIAGVCGAIAQRLGIPVLVVRVITVAISVVFPMIGIFVYFWIWLAFPLSPLAKDT